MGKSVKTGNFLTKNESKKRQTFDSIYFRGKSWRRWYTNYLVFQTMYIYFKRVSGIGIGNCIHFWLSKRLPDENITVLTTSDYSLNPQLSYFSTKTKVGFKGSCLRQDKIKYNHGKIVHFYIA